MALSDCAGAFIFSYSLFIQEFYGAIIRNKGTANETEPSINDIISQYSRRFYCQFLTSSFLSSQFHFSALIVHYIYCIYLLLLYKIGFNWMWSRYALQWNGFHWNGWSQNVATAKLAKEIKWIMVSSRKWNLWYTHMHTIWIYNLVSICTNPKV